jgi:hypothetical protein
MHDDLLEKLKDLNETVAKLNRSSDGGRIDLASSVERFEIAGEVAKFLQHSIVLLPPQASAEYCSKCGKKL